LRRSSKCEKLTDGRRTLRHGISSLELCSGELKTVEIQVARFLSFLLKFSPINSDLNIKKIAIIE